MNPEELRELKELVEFLKENQIGEFDLDRGDLKVRIKFAQEHSSAELAGLTRLLASSHQPHAAAPAAAPPATPPPPIEAIEAAAEEESLHIVTKVGSNRDPRGGYEVIALPVENNKATGEFEDFLTGFVLPDGKVWGRPVGVAVAKDGALLVTDDGSGIVWRVAYTGSVPN